MQRLEVVESCWMPVTHVHSGESWAMLSLRKDLKSVLVTGWLRGSGSSGPGIPGGVWGTVCPMLSGRAVLGTIRHGWADVRMALPGKGEGSGHPEWAALPISRWWPGSS